MRKLNTKMLQCFVFLNCMGLYCLVYYVIFYRLFTVQFVVYMLWICGKQYVHVLVYKGQIILLPSARAERFRKPKINSPLWLELWRRGLSSIIHEGAMGTQRMNVLTFVWEVGHELSDRIQTIRVPCAFVTVIIYCVPLSNTNSCSNMVTGNAINIKAN